MSELTFACALANPKIRTVIRSHALEIDWKSQQAYKLVSFLTDASIVKGTVQTAQLRSMLADSALDDEVNAIIKQCAEFIALGDNFQSVLDDFSEFYTTRRLTAELERKSKGQDSVSAKDIVKRIQDIKFVQTDVVPIDVLGDLDVDQVVEQELGGADPLPTRFEFIKRGTPYQGYLKGQVVQVVAPPGVGKSLFLANEAVEMAKVGAEGYFIALGDMMKIDFIIRFSSVILNEDYYKVSASPKKYFDSEEVRRLAKHIRVTVVPAGYMTPEGLSDLIENELDPVQGIDYGIVDYDANFAKTTDNMYAEGGAVYDTLSRIARPMNKQARLVFIASQPKIQFWGDEELPLECAAESARKQAIVDLQVTMGRNNMISQTKAGVIKIGKARRGKVNEKSHYRIKDSGLITEITSEDYTLLKDIRSK